MYAHFDNMMNIIMAKKLHVRLTYSMRSAEVCEWVASDLG